MYKVIFSDLDGTLLTDDKKICQKNIDAINKAKQKGVKFVFCTGRLPYCYDMFENDIDLSNAVSTNGTIVYSDGKLIKSKYLIKEDARKIIEYGIKNNEYERIFTFDYLYLLNPEKGGSDVNFYKKSKGVTHKEALDILENKDIYKLSFHADHNRLLEIRKDIEALGLTIDLVFSHPEFLEMIYKGESKGKGIEDYCLNNNIKLEETIGVGDEENDESMLKTVGLACCPSNAKDSVKEISDYVTNVDNNEGAIAEIIEKYVI